MKWLEKAKEKGVKDEVYINQVTSSYIQQGNWEEATKILKSNLDNYSNSPWIYLELIHAIKNQNDKKKYAEKLLELPGQIIKNTDNPDAKCKAFLDKAEAYHFLTQRSDFDRTLNDFHKFFSSLANPNNHYLDRYKKLKSLV